MEDKCHKASTKTLVDTDNVDTKVKEAKADISKTIRAEEAKPAEANPTKTREVVSINKSKIKDHRVRCQDSMCSSRPCHIQ